MFFSAQSYKVFVKTKKNIFFYKSLIIKWSYTISLTSICLVYRKQPIFDRGLLVMRRCGKWCRR